MILIGSVAFQAFARTDQPQHGHQMGPGRVSISADPLGIEIILLGMGTQPANRALAVLDASRERCLAEQAIIDGDANVSLLGVFDGALQKRARSFVAVSPASAVNEHQPGPWLVARFAGHDQV